MSLHVFNVRTMIEYTSFYYILVYIYNGDLNEVQNLFFQLQHLVIAINGDDRSYFNSNLPNTKRVIVFILFSNY